jgi:hydrogenase small subunit
MPFMDEPPGARLSSMAVGMYGTMIRSLRAITNSGANREPKWRHKGTRLTTGYETTEYGRKDGHNGHRH